MPQVTESLAGRAAVLKRLPLTQREIAGEPAQPRPPMSAPAASAMWSQILHGGYPELVKNPARDARLWQASYVQTYLEQDVGNLRAIGDLTLFQTLLHSLAGRRTGLLNLSDLARDVGIAVNTARDWLAILEASFQIFLLRPYHVNLGKRLIESPKVYFTDTRLLCYLVGRRDAEHAANGPIGGALLENWGVAELYKTSLHCGEPALYIWRTAAGAEVDIIVETAEALIPVEIKASATARPEVARRIAGFRRDFDDRAAPGYIIPPGLAPLPLGSGTLAWPLTAL